MVSTTRSLDFLFDATPAYPRTIIINADTSIVILTPLCDLWLLTGPTVVSPVQMVVTLREGSILSEHACSCRRPVWLKTFVKPRALTWTSPCTAQGTAPVSQMVPSFASLGSLISRLRSPGTAVHNDVAFFMF